MINPRPDRKLTHDEISNIIISIHLRPRSGMTCLERSLMNTPTSQIAQLFRTIPIVGVMIAIPCTFAQKTTEIEAIEGEPIEIDYEAVEKAIRHFLECEDVDELLAKIRHQKRLVRLGGNKRYPGSSITI